MDDVREDFLHGTMPLQGKCLFVCNKRFLSVVVQKVNVRILAHSIHVYIEIQAIQCNSSFFNTNRLHVLLSILC